MKHTFTALKTLCVAAPFALLSACGAQDNTAPQPEKTTTPTQTAAVTQTAAAELSPAEMLMKRGAKLYKRCQTCHTLNEGGKHKVGPNMWAIYGATAGQKEGFAYSKVMKESGVIWTDETLSAYIENPRKYMPGNRMSYAGLRKAEDRAAVLAYIKAQTTPE